MKWVCGLCSSVKLAPARPRKNDVRRYCLPCSEEQGHLVERTCPAREKATKERATKRKEHVKQVKRLVREHENARYSRAGYDIRDLVDEFWRLPAIKEARERLSPAPMKPMLKVRLSKEPSFASGRAWQGSHPRITFTLGSDVEAARLLQLTLHEVVHTAQANNVGHSDAFWALLHQAAHEAWPGIDPKPYRRSDRNGWYGRDRLITDALRIWLGVPDWPSDLASNAHTSTQTLGSPLPARNLQV